MTYLEIQTTLTGLGYTEDKFGFKKHLSEKDWFAVYVKRKGNNEDGIYFRKTKDAGNNFYEEVIEDTPIPFSTSDLSSVITEYETKALEISKNSPFK